MCSRWGSDRHTHELLLQVKQALTERPPVVLIVVFFQYDCTVTLRHEFRLAFILDLEAGIA